MHDNEPDLIEIIRKLDDETKQKIIDLLKKEGKVFGCSFYCQSKNHGAAHK